MATQGDVRRIALALPGTREATERFAFSIEVNGKDKGFAWTWNERLAPKKPRVPRPDVLAVRVAGPEEKALLLAADPEKFFTEPHYDGFPAVLVRLPKVTRAELTRLIGDAWRCQVPAKPPSPKASAKKKRVRSRGL